MGILEIFKRKKRDNRNNYTFTDEDREQATIKKMRNKILMDRLKHLQEIQAQRQTEEQIALLEDELYGDDDDDNDREPEDMDSKLVGLFEKILTKNAGLPEQTNPRSFNPTEVVAMIPSNIRKELKKKTPEEIKKLASMHYPDISPQEVDMIIPLL